jgi:hypothetical protein
MHFYRENSSNREGIMSGKIIELDLFIAEDQKRERDENGEFKLDPEQNINARLKSLSNSSGRFPILDLCTSKDGSLVIIFLTTRTELGTPKIEKLEFETEQIIYGEKYNKNLERLIEFIQTNPIFIFGFSIKLSPTKYSGHAILLKRINPTSIEVIDSNAQTWQKNFKYISSVPFQGEFIKLAFTTAGIENFIPSNCRFQTQRGSCFLWSIFFALYSEKTPEELEKMIDDVIKVVGLPQNNNSRDAVIMELMYQFIQTPIEPSKVGPEYRTGLGKSKHNNKMKCEKCGLLKGKALPENLDFLQQMTKQSYNIVDPQENINGWILKKWTPTMKFWMKGKDVIVGVRGTKTTEDVMTWGTIPLNTLDTTIVYKRDKAAVQQFQQQYPKNEYTYYAVGHSLGGAIIDNLLRAGLIKEALSYNPAIQYRDINGGLPNRRIYYGNDPLYRLMGWWDRKSEHREVENRTWGEFLSTFTTPGVAVEALSAHNLTNFTGGKKKK